MEDTELFKCRYCGTDIEVEVELLSSIDLRCPECGVCIDIPEEMLEEYGEI